MVVHLTSTGRSPTCGGCARGTSASGRGTGGAAAPGGEEEEAAVVVGALVGVGEGGVGGVDADEVVGGRGGGVREASGWTARARRRYAS